jgi:hypothetical protein
LSIPAEFVLLHKPDRRFVLKPLVNIRFSLPALCFLGLFATSCATRTVHPRFESNEYIQGFRKHFVNREVKVYHTTLADVNYTTHRDTLEALLSGQGLNGVLAYGKTDVPPIYEYYLMVNPKRRKLDLSGYPRVWDTVLRGSRVMFAGRGLGGDPFPEGDFRQITRSLQVGKGYPEELNHIADAVLRYSESAKFLQAYTEIAAYPVKDALEKDFRQQMELTYLCMLGDNPWYRKVLGEREGRYPRRPEETRALHERGLAGREEVIGALLSRTEGQQVVMFNENHFMPWHRILLTELLPGLKKQGFQYLALEALSGDSLLNAGAIPDLRSGFYTREQHFYRLLRTAQALGFEFVSYDARKGDRELLQARNLYRKTLGKDPDARVVVLAGLEHIYERGGESQPRMAQHFATLYGIDPLTISQTDLAHYRHEMESELVLVPSDSLERSRWQRVDLHVVNNLGWGYPPGDFRYSNTSGQPLQLALYNTDGWLSDYGYLGDIPEFSALLLPGEAFSVALPEGEYRFLLFDSRGEVVRNVPALEQVRR